MPVQQPLAKRAWLPARCATRNLRAARNLAVGPRAFMTKHDATQLTSAVKQFVAATNAHDVESLCSHMSKNVVSERSGGGGDAAKV